MSTEGAHAVFAPVAPFEQLQVENLMRAGYHVLFSGVVGEQTRPRPKSASWIWSLASPKRSESLETNAFAY